MADITNEIVKGISKRLAAVFGEAYAIYQNDVEQGLTKPCFFISILQPEVAPLLGRRAMRKNPFHIQYIPTDGGDNEEMAAVAEMLTLHLDYITLSNGDLLHGTGISYKIKDNALHFYINYNFPVIDTVEHTYMGDMDMKTRT